MRFGKKSIRPGIASFRKNPFFKTRMAHVSYHLVRHNTPQSAPEFHALLDHFRYLADLGYNSVCLEMEAMLPYSSAPLLATPLTWTPDQVRRISSLAAELGLEIVPLLQCLGHNYFALEQPAYAHLREGEGRFQQYCPLNPDTRTLYLSMVKDIRRFFPGAKRFHVGGDECRMLGYCPRCKKFAARHGVSALYAQHVVAVCKALLLQGVTPMLWGDMFEHHPQSLDLLPKKVQIVYWNYHPATWSSPTAVDLFRGKGFSVIGASGIFFRSGVSDLAGSYHECLDGIEDLTRILKDKNVTEHLVTNWTKGTSWELADWGYFFGAAKSRDPDLSSSAIARQYARYRFGLSSGQITEVHQLLAVPLPFAESVQHTWWDRLDRFDHTGSPYPERRARYLSPENKHAALGQIAEAKKRARRALEILWKVKSRIRRGMRQWILLENAAREMTTRADAAEMAMLEPAKASFREDPLGLAGRLEAVRRSLRARRLRTREVYGKSTPLESVTALCRIRYPKREEEHLEKLEEKLTGRRLIHGASPAVIPILYNPGPPYERGLEHGRVFADLIWNDIERLRERKNDLSILPSRDQMEAFLDKRFPWLIEEMNGIAAGAGLSLETVLWLNVYNATGDDRSLPCSSTALYRNGKEYGLLKITGSEEFLRKKMFVQVFEHHGMRIASLGTVGTVWMECGLNSEGLALGINRAPRPSSRPGQGLPQHILGYPLLASCRTTRDAIVFLKKNPISGKGLNIGVLDAKGKGVICEKAGHQIAFRPLKGNWTSATNHYVSKAMAPLNMERPPAEREESQARFRRIADFLNSSRLPVVEALKDCAALDKGKGRVRNPTPPFPGPGVTVTGAICDCKSRKMYITHLPPPGRKWAMINLASF